MNRSSSSDGKHGTTGGGFGAARGWKMTPDQAIWRVVQTGFVPAASVIFFVMSPTTLRSRFALSECFVGGLEIGKMSTPVTSNAGRYGFSASADFRGAWMITTGWFGSSARIFL